MIERDQPALRIWNSGHHPNRAREPERTEGMLSKQDPRSAEVKLGEMAELCTFGNVRGNLTPHLAIRR